MLPDICSRVCDQALQCEGACTWSLGDAIPVAIGALERFVADNAPIPPVEVAATTGVGIEVAIVGSGPAGIAAASELAGAGAKVTVYERDRHPGGLLRWGIPDFTLPDAVARRPWETLHAAGVEVHTDHEIAPGDLAELTDRFDAVVVAAGASTPLRLPVPGGDLAGVWDATRFLTEAHAALLAGTDLPALAAHLSAGGERDGAEPTVLVLGAGNTAMDVARTARRLGAQALCVDWMDRRFAPVRPDELDEAAAEGVEVRFSTTVERLDGTDGHVAEAYLASTRQRRAGQRPEVVPGTTTTQPVDLVVMAMGYRIAPDLAEAVAGVPIAKVVKDIPDPRWQASGILANPSPGFARHQPVGRLAIGREHARVTAGLVRGERIWVAGDALVGPSTVVEAMAQGKRAAQAIIAHQPRHPDRLRPAKTTEPRTLAKGDPTMTIDITAAALADLVRTQPSLAGIFDRLGLDYCCHGAQTFAQACAAAGIEMTDALTAVDRDVTVGGNSSDHLASVQLEPAALADHIEAVHHLYLRAELPELDYLAAKVAAVHEQCHPELAGVRRIVKALAKELLPHLIKEETALFPAIRALAGGGADLPARSLAAPVAVMAAEHQKTGQMLTELRSMTAAYQAPDDACASFTGLYERLEHLEADTHLHVFEENAILFPAALAMQATTPARPFEQRRLAGS